MRRPIFERLEEYLNALGEGAVKIKQRQDRKSKEDEKDADWDRLDERRSAVARGRLLVGRRRQPLRHPFLLLSQPAVADDQDGERGHQHDEPRAAAPV